MYEGRFLEPWVVTCTHSWWVLVFHKAGSQTVFVFGNAASSQYGDGVAQMLAVGWVQSEACTSLPSAPHAFEDGVLMPVGCGGHTGKTSGVFDDGLSCS